MKLFKAIHARWAADASLIALLAAAKAVSGVYQAASLALPFAVWKRPGDGEPIWDNAGDRTEFCNVVCVLYHSDYDDGLAIAAAIKTAFNRASFSLAGGENVMNMQLTAGYSEVQGDDGTWQFSIPFVCQVAVET